MDSRCVSDIETRNIGKCSSEQMMMTYITTIKRCFGSPSGRGGRATGGWILRRAAQTPRPAFCLLRSIRREVSFPFPSSFFCSTLRSESLKDSFPIFSYILLYINITYLYLIRFLHRFDNYLYLNRFRVEDDVKKKTFGIRIGSFAIPARAQIREYFNKRGVLEYFSNSCPNGNLGRGARATGGWAFGEKLKRRFGLSVFFAPFVAKCLGFFSVLPLNLRKKEMYFFPKYLYILLKYLDITYLCLNRNYVRVHNFSCFNVLRDFSRDEKESYGIGIGSFAIV